MKTTLKAILLLSLFVGPVAGAENVTVQTEYPIRYGEYDNVTAQYLSDPLAPNLFFNWWNMDEREEAMHLRPDNANRMDANVAVYGTATFKNLSWVNQGLFDTTHPGTHVSGVYYSSSDLLERYETALPTPNGEMVPHFFQVAAGKGPNGHAALKMGDNGWGLPNPGSLNSGLGVMMGLDTAPPGLPIPDVAEMYTVDPSVKTANLYSPITGNPTTYWYVEALKDRDFGKCASIGVRYSGVTLNDRNDDTFGPFIINGSEVHLGDPDSSIGMMQSVLIGTDTPNGDPSVILNVNGQVKAQGVTGFSSVQYKKDIVPLTPFDYQSILNKIEQIDVVRYRYKTDPKESKLRLGVIAEDSPKEMLSQDGKSIRLVDSVAFLAAGLKALEQRNVDLKKRLRELEKIKKIKDLS